MTDVTSAATTAGGRDGRLVRAIGTWSLAAGIVNLTIGGGIFRLPAGVATTLGAAAPVAYLVCAASMALIVLCFAEAGSRVSMTGGPYAYVETAFGPFLGFLAGLLLWVSVTLALSAVASFFIDAVGAMFPSLPLWGKRAALITTLVVLGGANARGVGAVARFNAIATVAKLAPLVVLIVVGLFTMRTENLRWSHTPSTSEVSRASILLMFAFFGVESALVPSGEVIDPARTVPRAIFAAMAVVTVLYIVIQVVAQGLLGSALAGDPTPLASAAAVALGPAGRTMILVGSIVSMFGYVSGMMLAVPRMLFALGRDGFLPRVVARVHPVQGTPQVAIGVQTVIVGVLAVSGLFEALAIASNVAALLVYAACAVAVLELRRRDVRTGGIPFRIPAGSVVPVAALAVIAMLLSSVQRQEWYAAFAVVCIATVIYAVTLPSRRARAVIT
ncbi:MAG: amino acid permease [Gemmatimonadota bacterium]|nr:amino acid permease [Gemmatimonadota bacterium]